MKVIRAIQFVTLNAAAYCAVATAVLVFVPDLYPTKEMTDRVQFAVFQLAILAFVAMLACWLAAKRVVR